MTKYFSWIPTVSGRLSYSHMGESTWPSKCVRINSIGGLNLGQAIFLQTRYCDDFVVPFLSRGGWRGRFRNKIVSYLSDKETLSGRHYFIGVVDEILDQDKPLDKLIGRVYPVLDIGAGQESSRRLIAKIKATIVDMASVETGQSQKMLSEAVKAIEGQIANVCPVVIKFSICRNGIIEITPQKLKSHSDNNMAVNDTVLKDYAEQAFFFLRDISHNHQHHEPDSDTIVRVHEGKDNYRKRIYFDLFRYIIRFKRTRSPKNIMRASGLLAYANSFKSINKNGEDDDFPNDYQVENLKMSFDAAQFELDYNAQQKNSSLSFALTVSFSFFGALLALTSLSQFAIPSIRGSITPDPIVINITSWIAENPIEFSAYSFMLGYILMLYTNRVQPHQFVWFENIQRLFSHVRRWLFVLPVAILGIAVIAIGLWLLLSNLT